MTRRGRDRECAEYRDGETTKDIKGESDGLERGEKKNGLKCITDTWIKAIQYKDRTDAIKNEENEDTSEINQLSN